MKLKWLRGKIIEKSPELEEIDELISCVENNEMIE